MIQPTSAMGALLSSSRLQIVAELRDFTTLLADAEDVARTLLEKQEALIGAALPRKRPIGELAKEIKECSELLLLVNYAQYALRLTIYVHKPPSNFYLIETNKFQLKYPSSVLSQVLILTQNPTPSKERSTHLAVLYSDNCLWQNRQIEKLQQPNLGDKMKELEAHQREARRSEREACEHWQATSDQQAKTQSKIEMGASVLGTVVGIGAAVVVTPLSVPSTTFNTLQTAGNSAQTGASTGNSLGSTFANLISGKPQFIEPNDTKDLKFKTLSNRVRYAFQSKPSGSIGRLANLNPLKTEPQQSHTVGRLEIRVGTDPLKPFVFSFNFVGHFPIEPMDYWNFCQELWGAVEKGELPPDECVDEILIPLAEGEVKPDNSPPKKGFVDERLAFCTDRLRKYCEAKRPPKKKPESRSPVTRSDMFKSDQS